MKWLKYKLCTVVHHGAGENQTTEQVFTEKTMAWSEAAEAIAKAEAWNGEYTIEDAPELSVKEQIAELKKQLAKTDYTVIKIAEGAATAEEYADVIALRQGWRAQINALEAQ